MIRLTAEFECGNGKNIRETGPGCFRLEVNAERQTAYASYFCFDVINDGPATEVTVEVWEDSRFGGPTHFARNYPTTIWFRPEGLHRYRPLRGQTPECVDGHVALRVPVEADRSVRVTMTYAAPYSEMVEELDRMATEREDRCSQFSVGDSVEGRALAGLRAGTPGKPRITCVGGQHAHEHSGVWAALGVADFVSSRLPAAADLRKRFEVFVVPVINPDGNVQGRSYTAEGLDLYQAFGEAVERDGPEGHEARLLWRWIEEGRPALWVNFHAYTGWPQNSEYPYHGWYEVADRGVFREGRQRAVYGAVCDALRLETDAASSHERASVHRENSFCHQMARRYGIPHAFYELNNGTSGRQGAIRTGIEVFRKVVAAMVQSEI